WRDAGMPSGVPAEIATAIGGRQLAITTARAAAAAPATVDDVLEALRYVDAGAVRDWLAESGQRFSLNGDQVADLTRADVPQSVLQAMMGWSPQRQVAGAVDSSRVASDVYLSSRAGSGMYGAAPQSTVI